MLRITVRHVTQVLCIVSRCWKTSVKTEICGYLGSRYLHWHCNYVVIEFQKEGSA